MHVIIPVPLTLSDTKSFYIMKIVLLLLLLLRLHIICYSYYVYVCITLFVTPTTLVFAYFWFILLLCLHIRYTNCLNWTNYLKVWMVLDYILDIILYRQNLILHKKCTYNWRPSSIYKLNYKIIFVLIRLRAMVSTFSTWSQQKMTMAKEKESLVIIQKGRSLIQVRHLYFNILP